MKKTFAANEMLVGRARVLERQADEIGDLRRRLQSRREMLRTAAVALRAEHRSVYVRRRLDGLLSALRRMDGLDELQGRALRDIEKYVGRLLRTDLVDHFSRSLHRRVQRIARREVGPRIRTDILRGPLWYRVRIGELHLAIHGRLRRFQRAARPLRVELPADSTKTLRVFPGSHSLLHGVSQEHNYLAIFSIAPSEIAAVHCDGLAVLPSLFQPRTITPVSHPDLAGRLRYGGRLLYVWRSLSMAAPTEGTVPLEGVGLDSALLP